MDVVNEVRLVLEKEKKGESVLLLKSWGEVKLDGGLKGSSRYSENSFVCLWPVGRSLKGSSSTLLRSRMIPESFSCRWKRQERRDTTSELAAFMHLRQ